MNILMIEDDIRSMLFANILKSNSYAVTIVDNFTDAVEILQINDEAYDAILLDLAMDGRDLPDGSMKDIVVKRGVPSGCVFHEMVLEKTYPKLAKRTLFFTGVPQAAKESTPDWYDRNSMFIIPKTEPGYKSRVLAFLERWNN